MVSNLTLHTIIDEYVSSVPVGHTFDADTIIGIASGRKLSPTRLTVTKVIRGDRRIRIIPKPYADSRPRQYEKVCE